MTEVNVCYVCRPDAPADALGALCMEHKGRCVLADGSSLRETLDQARPAGFPLEGNLLSLVYNPVFVVEAGVRHAGFADFAGGGMAVLENRHGAENWFEFWVTGREEASGLLRLFGGPVPPSVSTVPVAQRVWLGLAYDMWRRVAMVRDRLTALGRWPRSFEELQTVIGGVEQGSPEDSLADGAFSDAMRRLAHRSTRNRNDGAKP